MSLSDKNLLMCPGIDAIDADTFKYIFTNKTMVGYFDWNLDFKWQSKDKFSWKIYDMPAMSGGIFAIHKKFFEHLGFYDPGKVPSVDICTDYLNLLFGSQNVAKGKIFLVAIFSKIGSRRRVEKKSNP